jgi:hypothetical protein
MTMITTKAKAEASRCRLAVAEKIVGQHNTSSCAKALSPS